ncbi:hypothetical protein [Peptostreptococcus faecalis]|uniref:hypothetical protein n=1 Tax=Peptostreptococcus faecalis TaxID=2045015 RepID=UPI000C7AD739|nr:hypothetical protein [Peptostreptococcus faecalis]
MRKKITILISIILSIIVLSSLLFFHKEKNSESKNEKTEIIATYLEKNKLLTIGYDNKLNITEQKSFKTSRPDAYKPADIYKNKLFLIKEGAFNINNNIVMDCQDFNKETKYNLLEKYSPDTVCGDENYVYNTYNGNGEVLFSKNDLKNNKIDKIFLSKPNKNDKF